MSAVQKHLQTAAAGIVRSAVSGFAPSATPDVNVMLKNEIGGVNHDRTLGM